jgi:hypothetical protein
MSFTRVLIIGGVALPLALVVESPPAQAAARAGESVSGDSGQGRDLDHSVANCVECHTPRDARGDLDSLRLLRGAPIPLASPYPHRPWACEAPSLAGLPGWRPAEAIQLLMAGRRPGGRVPCPPMPVYRMSLQAAADVVACLKSLR